ncbi:acyl carrier protein [Vibrio sp. CAU 1672]|uniref:acyl carrier protein n=1 Tax=Vibrio sp. CAU 1672 TaxID=3032594 RepID=UPI0023DC1A9D|nr:acyl carrier protein [Vibrio sp. CAU 1672]MDF2153930.1 acyl carrier protein [Vibrio sp. CAU 1672]
MNKEQFLEELTEILQLENLVDEQTVLSDLEEWDSMAHLGVISFFDMEFSKSITNTDLKQVGTVSELIVLAGL